LSDPTELYPHASHRAALVACVHCTGENHLTRRLCVSCGHEVRIAREHCLCDACVREPARPEWRHASRSDFPGLEDTEQRNGRLR
jgi:hypothetical protein